MLIFVTALLAYAAPPDLEAPGGRISVSFLASPRTASDSQVTAFIARSAVPVSKYYGRFPVPHLTVEVLPNRRNPEGLFGQEFHGELIKFFLGAQADAARLGNDQILTHEMFHLGFPDLAREYAWVEEGLATYLAHLARARAAQTSEEEFWADAANGFADAQRRPGEGGFAEEDDYHRMYWGGALFWFEIDLELRARSQGKKSLDTVTRAILAMGGTNAHKWSLARLARAVDGAAGIKVFRKWYDFFGQRPGRAELDRIWSDLGVVRAGKSVRLDDAAPLASTRRAMLKNLP